MARVSLDANPEARREGSNPKLLCPMLLLSAVAHTNGYWVWRGSVVKSWAADVVDQDGASVTS